ncbi:hypothetical protein K490DRAFT_60307 [Saccharata proteae CBS 121410]|uniref:Uncharacterized protein n=1 Tax=Saccharata proteae CBS 121410 TaxID=1314787 RepID=A0A9P4LTD4_9PEZI|nr:hypothetical protein K490DRAFT_60307 [Saccharata proteae CBS 121410]
MSSTKSYSMWPQQKCNEFSAVFDPTTPHDNLISLSAIKRFSLGAFKPATDLKESRPLLDRNRLLRSHYIKRNKQPDIMGPKPPRFLCWYFCGKDKKEQKHARTKDGKPLQIVGTIEVRWDDISDMTIPGRKFPERREQHYKFLVVENLAFDMVFSFKTMLELGLVEKPKLATTADPGTTMHVNTVFRKAEASHDRKSGDDESCQFRLSSQRRPRPQIRRRRSKSIPSSE